MNGYVHQDREAIGVCVNCGKFICAECAMDIQNKYYCKTCMAELFTQKSQEAAQAKQAASQPQQPMVFMNAGGGGAAASSSSSAAGGAPYRPAPPYPTNSVIIHLLLAFFTCGIGNLIYYLYVKNQQSKWLAMYR